MTIGIILEVSVRGLGLLPYSRVPDEVVPSLARVHQPGDFPRRVERSKERRAEARREGWFRIAPKGMLPLFFQPRPDIARVPRRFWLNASLLSVRCSLVDGNKIGGEEILAGWVVF